MRLERRIHLDRNFAYGAFDLYGAEIKDGKRYLYTNATAECTEPTPGLRPVAPTLRLEESDCQQLLQQLWDAGLRPNNGEGTAGHVDAMKYHLEDMRRLVFGAPAPDLTSQMQTVTMKGTLP